MLYDRLHAQPIDASAFLLRQMLTLAKSPIGGGAFVQGGLITPIALYLGHKASGWLKKKNGTILCCIKDEEDELPHMSKCPY